MSLVSFKIVLTFMLHLNIFFIRLHQAYLLTRINKKLLDLLLHEQ